MLLESQIAITEADYRRISDVVYRHCGINLHDGKRELVRARIAKRLRLTNCHSASAYLDQVLADPDGGEFTHLIDALSTNLTSFFRESKHFAYLEEHFLPHLLETKRRAGIRRIRAWSAGCSSGEEPYSLALVLRNACPDTEGWDIRLLATDISTRVLRAAQAGVYDKDRVQNVPPLLKQRYLATVRVDGASAFQVVPAVRQLIRFAHLNLMEPWPFSGPFDLIFCRNVMIYFDKPTQQSLVNRFWEVLGQGGLLFTGHSEAHTGIRHDFRYVQPTIYARP